MSRITRGVAAAAFGFACLAAPRALAWGPVVHQAVTEKAIDTLPKGIKPFYRNHRLEMPTLALEPEIPDEGTDRRFAVDKLMPFPFDDLPRSEEQLKARFGDAAGQVGRLPWLLLESYGRLVEAFRAKDKNQILAESDRLAGFVADLHNPLALTENADGQKTSQHGLWVRFSVKLPESLQKQLKLSPEAARYLDDPKEYVFSTINAIYVWVDNLIYGEGLARRGHSGYTEIYYDFLALRAKAPLQDRLSEAASAVGSFWYSAWTAAGRPELN